MKNDIEKLKSKIKVYIASPYTLGDVAINVKTQMDMADKLLDLGFIPFTPEYLHFQHMMHPRSYEEWMEYDKVWVLTCNCLLRLEGKSSGADEEVSMAKQAGIPVFYSVEELVEYYKNKN